MSGIADYATMGLFGFVDFAKECTNHLTGLSTTADGLYKFYGLCRFSGAIDQAYNTAVDNITEYNYYPQSVINLFEIEKALKIQMYVSMNDIANAVEEVSWDDKIKAVRSMEYRLW